MVEPVKNNIPEPAKVPLTQIVPKLLEKTSQNAIPKAKKNPKVQDAFKYNVKIGNFSIACHSTYESELKNLDKIIKYLDTADIENKEDVKDVSWRKTAKHFKSKIQVRLARLWNFIFGGGHPYYNEACARKIVKFYANHADVKTRNDALSKQVLELHDKLAQIKHGKGTYVDGIDRDLIIGNKHTFQNWTYLLSGYTVEEILEFIRKEGASALVNGVKEFTDKALSGVIDIGEQVVFSQMAKYLAETALASAIIPGTSVPVVNIAVIGVILATKLLKWGAKAATGRAAKIVINAQNPEQTLKQAPAKSIQESESKSQKSN